MNGEGDDWNGASATQARWAALRHALERRPALGLKVTHLRWVDPAYGTSAQNPLPSGPPLWYRSEVAAFLAQVPHLDTLELLRPWSAPMWTFLLRTNFDGLRRIKLAGVRLLDLIRVLVDLNGLQVVSAVVTDNPDSVERLFFPRDLYSLVVRHGGGALLPRFLTSAAAHNTVEHIGFTVSSAPDVLRSGALDRIQSLELDVASIAPCDLIGLFPCLPFLYRLRLRWRVIHDHDGTLLDAVVRLANDRTRFPRLVLVQLRAVECHSLKPMSDVADAAHEGVRIDGEGIRSFVVVDRTA
jgi:hypothetical protein